ncbi:MAG: glycoside hydrolase family 1 protein, partial [Planctomycetota bacterium]
MDEDFLRFPDGFVWGAATAAYQIEGAVNEDARGPSIWDTFSHAPGNVLGGDDGDVADDHYHRYQEDVERMAWLGLDAYRFSIAWPRVIPDGRGAVNEAGLDFYERLVDALLAHGITPFATLYHWDLPQALEDAGGWPARATADHFQRYARVVGERLGDRVKHWMTFNEPWEFVNRGYSTGQQAPGRREPPDALAQLTHHVLLAHGRAVGALREACGREARVGIVLNPLCVWPATESPEDREAAERAWTCVNGWWTYPI